MRSKPGNNHAGLTLIELVLSITLFFFIFLFAAQIFTTATNTSIRNRNTIALAKLGQQAVETIRQRPIPSSAPSGLIPFAPPNQLFAYSVEYCCQSGPRSPLPSPSTIPVAGQCTYESYFDGNLPLTEPTNPFPVLLGMKVEASGPYADVALTIQARGFKRVTYHNLISVSGPLPAPFRTTLASCPVPVAFPPSPPPPPIGFYY